MTQIDRDELKKMMDENVVTVVDVLDTPSYEKFHIPTTINVPLDSDFDERIVDALPDKDNPVELYCMDEDRPAGLRCAA